MSLLPAPNDFYHDFALLPKECQSTPRNFDVIAPSSSACEQESQENTIPKPEDSNNNNFSMLFAFCAQ